VRKELQLRATADKRANRRLCVCTSPIPHVPPAAKALPASWRPALGCGLCRRGLGNPHQPRGVEVLVGTQLPLLMPLGSRRSPQGGIFIPRTYVLRAEAAEVKADVWAKPQGPLAAEGTALGCPVSGRAALFALSFQPTCVVIAFSPKNFSSSDKILPAPVLGTGYIYVSPYITDTFSEFEHHLKPATGLPGTY